MNQEQAKSFGKKFVSRATRLIAKYCGHTYKHGSTCQDHGGQYMVHANLPIEADVRPLVSFAAENGVEIEFQSANTLGIQTTYFPVPYV